MKKYLLFIIFLILITGCSKDNFKVNMIMEKDNDTYIAINYPSLNIKKIDKEISNYIDNSYNNFIYDNSKNKELNIDYEYQDLDNYISIVLRKYQNIKDEVTEDIKCMLYSKKDDEFVNLSSVLKDNKGFNTLLKSKILNKYKDIELNDVINISNINFNNFDKFKLDEKLTLFLENNNSYLEIEFDYSELGINDINYVDKKIEIMDEVIVKNVIDPNKKVVAITFDDGPSYYTDEIVDILRDNDAVGTFFVLGNKVDHYHDVIKKAYSYGNEIGNHTYNHKWLSRLSTDEIVYQIDKTNEEIKKIIGTSPTYLRPTYGSVNSRIRNNTNMEIALWTVDPKDWKNKSPEDISNDILKKVNDEDIVLLHDTHKRTVNALKLLIPKLREKGYQFVTLSELDEVKQLRIN